MSTTNSSNAPSKRRLIKDSPFKKLYAPIEELSQVSLQDAYTINIDLIELNPNQPRKYIDQERLNELAADIKVRGILQPPIVRRAGEKYQLIVGERRYRAALIAELSEIPVLVKEFTDQEAQIVSLVENIQREDLEIADEATYFKMLQDEYKFSIRAIAELVNKSKSYVESRLKLLGNPKLMQEVQAHKLGLHEATMLARLENLEQDAALTGVREKDTSPTDDESVREKDSYNDFSPPARHFLRQCRRLINLNHDMGSRLQKLAENEREATLETIEELETELGKLKHRLHRHR